MSYKEQFFKKEYNKEELMSGYISKLSYEEYIYYLACLSDYFYKQRKYQKALFFYDHLLRSIGCTVLLNKFDQAGRPIPKELKKYLVNLDEITNSKEAEVLSKKIDKIAAIHTSKRFGFQMIMIVVGLVIGLILHLLKVDTNICLIAGFGIAAIIPLFYRPKPVTIDKGVELEKSLEYVSRHNKDLIEFVQQKVNKDKKFKEIKDSL